jgi:hypothetical protein
MSKSQQRHMQERSAQLGMPYGTARNKLNKLIMFNLVQILDLDVCHHCGGKIESEENLSVEHKKPWLHEPNAKDLFFDIENIAFSHHKCNSAAARKDTEMIRTKVTRIGSSGYKGVRLRKDPRPNQKKYCVKYKGEHLALGDDPKELALLYDKKAIQEEGPGAITNASLGLL